MFRRLIASAACAGLLSVSAAPALADGAASTRNIIFGAAAAGVGTWAIVNHNKKVHQKIDEKDAQISSQQAQISDAQGSAQSEYAAYVHEAAVANHYKSETAALKREVASLEQQVAQARTMPAGQSAQAAPPLHVASVSYGWGTL